jgi:hypothetical protein
MQDVSVNEKISGKSILSTSESKRSRLPQYAPESENELKILVR